MRVLVVTSEWPTDQHPAAGIFVASQVEKLRHNGLDVEVFAFRGARNPLRYFRAHRRLARLLRNERFDVIHAHFGQSGLVVLPTDVPFVVTFHGSDLLGVVSKRGRYTLVGLIQRAVGRLVARRADRAIVVGQRLARRLPRTVRPEIIPMGIDRDVFRPIPVHDARAALGLPVDERLVLFNGDPAFPVKRYELAAEVMRRLRTPARLITLSGEPRTTVSDYMNACDALLVTSRHESGPLMAQEALACGLPVVSVDVGDVAMWTKGLGGCQMCADDDPSTIAAALDGVLASPSRIMPPPSSIEDADVQAARVIAVYEDLTGTRPERNRG